MSFDSDELTQMSTYGVNRVTANTPQVFCCVWDQSLVSDSDSQDTYETRTCSSNDQTCVRLDLFVPEYLRESLYLCSLYRPVQPCGRISEPNAAVSRMRRSRVENVESIRQVDI